MQILVLHRESEKKPAMDQAMRDALKKHIVREIIFKILLVS